MFKKNLIIKLRRQIEKTDNSPSWKKFLHETVDLYNEYLIKLEAYKKTPSKSEKKFIKKDLDCLSEMFIQKVYLAEKIANEGI